MMRKIIISSILGLMFILYVIDNEHNNNLRLIFALVIIAVNIISFTNNKIVLFIIPFVLCALSIFLRNNVTHLISIFYLPVIILLVENKLIREKNTSYFQIVLYILEIVCFYYAIMLIINIISSDWSGYFKLNSLFFVTLLILVGFVVIYKKFYPKEKKKKAKDADSIIWKCYFVILILKLVFAFESSFNILENPQIDLYAIIMDFIFVSCMLQQKGKKLPEFNFIKESMSEG